MQWTSHFSEIVIAAFCVEYLSLPKKKKRKKKKEADIQTTSRVLVLRVLIEYFIRSSIHQFIDSFGGLTPHTKLIKRFMHLLHMCLPLESGMQSSG